MTPRFAGSAVIVVGGAGGLGSRTTERLLDEGAQVVVLDRAPTEPMLAARLAGEVRVDLGDGEAVVRAMRDAVSMLGGLDVLVNAAGILRIEPFVATELRSWDTVMAVNARAAFLVMREAAAVMIAAGQGGRIVSIASMAAKAGAADQAVYAASKAAVVALTRVGALEWGKAGITVNCVCPGYVPTQMGADTRTDDDIRTWSAMSPLGRLGTPDDVASTILFLASPDAAYLTGQAVNVTGGMVMH